MLFYYYDIVIVILCTTARVKITCAGTTQQPGSSAVQHARMQHFTAHHLGKEMSVSFWTPRTGKCYRFAPQLLSLFWTDPHFWGTELTNCTWKYNSVFFNWKVKSQGFARTFWAFIGYNIISKGERKLKMYSLFGKTTIPEWKSR